MKNEKEETGLNDNFRISNLPLHFAGLIFNYSFFIIN